MITPQEILAGLSDPTRQVINSGVSQAEFEEIGGVYCMLRNDKTHDDDYKTSLPIPNMQNFVRGMAGCKKDGNEFRRNYAFAFAVLKVIAQPYKNKGAAPIPQEIRLVAAYMAYRAMELADRKYRDIEKADKAVSQSEILKGLGLGHNAFTKWGMRPKQYYYVTHYKQPNSPIHYMGAKTGDYGYAVRNLVYQAGQHTVFADIFGGGGNATLAVPPVDTVQCYYNEVETMVYNTVDVLKSGYKMPIELWKQFGLEVQGKGESELMEGYLKAVDIEKEDIHQAIERGYKEKKKKKAKEHVGHVKDVTSAPVISEIYEIKEFVEKYNDALYKRGSSYTYEKDGRIYVSVKNGSASYDFNGRLPAYKFTNVKVTPCNKGNTEDMDGNMFYALEKGRAKTVPVAPTPPKVGKVALSAIDKGRATFNCASSDKGGAYGSCQVQIKLISGKNRTFICGSPKRASVSHSSLKENSFVRVQARFLTKSGKKTVFGAWSKEYCFSPKVEYKADKFLKSSGKIRLSWKKVSGATGYKVYTSTGRDKDSFSCIKTATKCSYDMDEVGYITQKTKRGKLLYKINQDSLEAYVIKEHGGKKDWKKLGEKEQDNILKAAQDEFEGEWDSANKKYKKAQKCKIKVDRVMIPKTEKLKKGKTYYYYVVPVKKGSAAVSDKIRPVSFRVPQR